MGLAVPLSSIIMFKWFVIGAVSVPLFKALYWSFKMSPKWICVLMLGAKGRGKSVTLAMRAHKWKGTVYAPSPDVYNGNGRSKKYGEVRYFDVQEWINGGCPPFPKGSLIILDEAGLIANSRKFATLPTQMMKYFKFVRKAKNKVYIASQRPDVDKAIRDLCDRVYMCDRYGSIGVQWTLQPILGQQIVVTTDGKKRTEVIDGYQKAKGLPKLVYLPKWFKYLDSNSMTLFGEGKPYWSDYSDTYANDDFYTGGTSFRS